MKYVLLSLVLSVSSCLQQPADDPPCFGLSRTDVACVYNGTFAPGYECDKLVEVQYDFKRLPDDEVTIVCGATDLDAEITIHKPAGTDCAAHFVTGCIAR